MPAICLAEYWYPIHVGQGALVDSDSVIKKGSPVLFSVRIPMSGPNSSISYVKADCDLLSWEAQEANGTSRALHVPADSLGGYVIRSVCRDSSDGEISSPAKIEKMAKQSPPKLLLELPSDHPLLKPKPGESSHRYFVSGNKRNSLTVSKIEGMPNSCTIRLNGVFLGHHHIEVSKNPNQRIRVSLGSNMPSYAVGELSVLTPYDDGKGENKIASWTFEELYWDDQSSDTSDSGLGEKIAKLLYVSPAHLRVRSKLTIDLNKQAEVLGPTLKTLFGQGLEVDKNGPQLREEWVWNSSIGFNLLWDKAVRECGFPSFGAKSAKPVPNQPKLQM